MRKITIFLGIIVVSVIAASVFPLFGNSVEEAVSGGADLTALAPVTEKSPATAARGGCGGSCCSKSGDASQAAGKTEQIKAYLTDYYTQKLGGDIEVLVSDLGCHHEAEIRQGDEVIARLSINGGVITRIG